jgi:RNA polymerase sigma-70 factor (ECF subfamily)
MAGLSDLFKSGAWSRLNRLSDEELIAEIGQGRHDALTVLFDRYGRLLYTIAERILRDQGESEEVVQTVLLHVFRKVSMFDPLRGSAKVWLIQLAYYLSLQRRRHLESQRFYVAEEIESVADEIARHAQRKSFGFSTQETQCLIREALGLLKEQQRLVIEKTFFEGLSPDEIAELTGSNVVSVRHNLYRGLNKLRQHLDLQSAVRLGETEKELRFRKGGIANVRA